MKVNVGSESSQSESESIASFDFSLETISSDSDNNYDYVMNWNTNQNTESSILTVEEELSIIEQSIRDISLQEDIIALGLVSIDIIDDMTSEELEEYKIHLLELHEEIPRDMITTVNYHLTLIYNKQNTN